MFPQTVRICIFVLIQVSAAQKFDYGFMSDVKFTNHTIELRNQGLLKGVIVEPKVNRKLSPVERYLGVPYASPPRGERRFMPPSSAVRWDGIRIADTFGPVCPQKFPNEANMSQSRKEYFRRLVKFLRNQSEDCLYLNIYAPLQGE